MLFTEIIKDNKTFMKCYRKGRFVSSDIVVAYFIPNKLPFNRLGITAGKKQGNAVQRNRIKRIIRAAYRLNEDKLPIGFDIVFVGRKNICEKTSNDIDAFINKRLLREINKPAADRKNNYNGKKKNSGQKIKK